MATITHDTSLGWETNVLPTVGFANAADLKIADMLWSSALSKQDFLDAAWVTIEADLGLEFEVPLAAGLPRSTCNYLRTIHAYMASSAILIETHSGGDDNVSATGLWMRSEADSMIARLIAGFTLEGLVRRIEDTVVDEDTLLARNVPGISTKDAVSPFDSVNAVLHGAVDANIHPRGGHSAPYVPGTGLTRR